ncbi:MAG: hypothetical protein HY000_34815 [Planctomycetes bacterium]|nr:hypothetical protein [Planctomycetota bacterium]
MPMCYGAGTNGTLELEQALVAEDDAKRRTLIERALAGERHLLERVHALSARLRPSMLDDLGLKEAVRSLLADYEGRTGIVSHATLRFDRADVPAAVGDNLFRILQEALINVAKHSGAKEVFVNLDVTADRVALNVRDAGAGFDLERLNGRGLGILGMRERAELLGGAFTLRSDPAYGTEVSVEVPLRKSDVSGDREND